MNVLNYETALNVIKDAALVRRSMALVKPIQG